MNAVDDHTYLSLDELSGYLAAPGDLEVIAKQRSILLRWIPPFSLYGVQILGYVVNFTDVTDANASTTETVSLNYTEREIKFTTESLQPCRRYQFFIWALNDVGNGNLSKINASFQNGK